MAKRTDNGEFTIKRGVPIPPSASAPGRPPIYPFNEMQVGDCFVVPFNGRTPKQTANSVAGSSARKRHPGKRFVTRILTAKRITALKTMGHLPENWTEEGFAVWRVE